MKTLYSISLLLFFFSQLTAQNGEALDFNGAVGGFDQIAVPDNDLLDLGDDFSIEYWVNFRQTDRETDGYDWQCMFSKKQMGIGPYALALLTEVSIVRRLRFFHPNLSPSFTDVIWADVAPDQWYHIAVTYNGANMIVYIDGLEVRNNPVTGSLPNNTESLLIGHSNQGYPLDGRMDEFRIWDHIRSPSEIQENMNCELSGSECGLILYYKLNQGIAGANNTGINKVIDQSPNNLEGTLGSFALDGAVSNWVAPGNVSSSCTNIPVLVSPTDLCEGAAPTSISGGKGWINQYDSNCGHLFASINAPNGVDLGAIQLDIIQTTSVEAQNLQSNGTIKLIPRRFKFSSPNYPSGVNFPSPISLRLYFTEAELQAMNAANLGNNGITNHAASDINISHYFGPNLDCDYSNNSMISENVDLIIPSYSSYGSEHALEFTINHFSEFILHEPANISLSLLLEEFRASKQGDAILLKWKMLNEELCAGFEIQHSTDAISWEVLDFISTGNQSQYSFLDTKPQIATNYYRLRITNHKGSSEFSDVAALDYHKNQAISIGDISPNPLKDKQLNLEIYLTKNQDALLEIYSYKGELLETNQQELRSGTLSIPLTNLSAGGYILKLQIASQSYIRRFVVFE